MNKNPLTTNRDITMSINIIDRPCGTGKTQGLLASFNEADKYLVIVPLLTEVTRVLEGACVPFSEPTDDHTTKTDSLRDLLIMGGNVVTTHKMYSMLTAMVREGLLDDYHIIIDEVPDVVKDGAFVKPKSYDEFYIKPGYVIEDPETGQVLPTPKWDADIDAVADSLQKQFYHEAKSGCLYRVDGGFFLWAIPVELLTRNLSLTVYTYLAKGSMLLAYLDKLNIKYNHDKDQKLDAAFRLKAKELITIETIPALSKMNLSASGQSKMTTPIKKTVSNTLKKLRENKLKGIPIENIATTCLKSNWFLNSKSKSKTVKTAGFSVKTGMFKANWLSNTTRGTNEYVHVNTMIYLWNQYMNDYLRRWLEMDDYHKSNDDYGTSELIQWVYRSQVRKGLPITLYLPSERMRGLLEDWLNGEDLKEAS